MSFLSLNMFASIIFLKIEVYIIDLEFFSLICFYNLKVWSFYSMSHFLCIPSMRFSPYIHIIYLFYLDPRFLLCYLLNAGIPFYLLISFASYNWLSVPYSSQLESSILPSRYWILFSFPRLSSLPSALSFLNIAQSLILLQTIKLFLYVVFKFLLMNFIVFLLNTVSCGSSEWFSLADLSIEMAEVCEEILLWSYFWVLGMRCWRVALLS